MAAIFLNEWQYFLTKPTENNDHIKFTTSIKPEDGWFYGV
jgi:hypothetical protein